jgi:hypothetical protein
MPLAVEAVLAGLVACFFTDGHIADELSTAQPLEGTSVILTNDHRTATFPLSTQIVLTKQIVRIDLVGISNPLKDPFYIGVYLGVRLVNGGPYVTRAEIGSISPYPPDHPGNFSMDTSSAVRALSASTAKLKSAKLDLLLELKPSHPDESLTSVRVTVGYPEWRVQL